MGFPEPMMPNWLRAVRDRLTRDKVERGVNSTCPTTDASDNAVEHHHCRIRSVAVDSSRASIRIIFANGG